MTGCKFTLSRKGRERAKVTTNTREEIARPARPTRGVQTSTRARTVAPWIMGVTVSSVSSTRRKAGAEYLLLDSGAQLHACPISYSGQKKPLLNPGMHTASGARLQHDGGRLVTYKLPEGRTIRVLFHACAVQKAILSLAVSFSRGTGAIFVQTLEHCSFLTISRRNGAKHSCIRERVCFLSKG